jgi:co-chaperonin GroES (HSP10)
MVNKSGYHPIGYAVLVKLDYVETTSGMLALSEQTIATNIANQQKATLIEVGQMAWSDESSARCSVGDRVFIKRYAGDTIEVVEDGVKRHYRILMDKDLYATIDKEQK